MKMFKTLHDSMNVYILCHMPFRLWIVDIVSHADQVAHSQHHRNSNIGDAEVLYAVQIIK